MEHTGYSHILDDFSKRIYLFETLEEVDDFLKEAVSLLMKEAGASLGAVFVHDPVAQDLAFRVGYDDGDFWDHYRCGKKDVSLRFSLNDTEVGKAFSEGAIRYINYPADDAEHPFHSKILIPIVRGPEKMGVFLMAHEEGRAFDHIDQGEMLNATSRLGDMLAEATVLLHKDPELQDLREGAESRVIKGMKASHGYAEGKALAIWADMESALENLPPQGSIEEELLLFRRALDISLEQLNDIQNTASSIDTEMISLIFTAQYYMLKDKSLVGKIEALVQEGLGAAQAVRRVIDEYAHRFSRMAEIRLAEKAQDVRDLGFRLLTNMGRPRDEGFSYEGRIVLSRHIYPSDLFRLAVEKVSGLVLRGTGITAHISILARSLHLPVLISDDPSLLTIPEGTPLLLDATGGRLYVRPDKDLRRELQSKRRTTSSSPTAYTLKGRTSDGVHVEVSANVNLYNDAKEAVSQGAEGIGLYRSEFPFILKEDFLSEEQQYRIYKAIIDTQGNRPVIMRTTDIGGDKLLQGRSEGENNPFLGVRGIRFSLANREMFRDQLKAMLRAGAGRDLGIMLPMVSDVEEILLVREELALCLDQLSLRKAVFNPQPRIGAMIELPSAAMSVDEIARETDFLSIGSNDLTMYLLAVDRTNEQLSHLYRSHHPSVLKVFAAIARDAGEKIAELSVCGDVASDPMLVPFFVGLGLRKLSVIPSKVEAVKQVLRRFSRADTEEIAREILSIRRINDMDEYSKEFHRKYA